VASEALFESYIAQDRVQALLTARYEQRWRLVQMATVGTTGYVWMVFERLEPTS
jgi:hypothetical protein